MVKLENTKAQVHSVFPTPVYVVNLGLNLPSVMLDYLYELEFNEHNPGYGMISKNNYIMDAPIMEPLGDWVLACMKDYATNVMRYKYKDLVFTQSWLTKKLQGTSHKAHTHPNTLISSVFYFEMNEGDPPLCFSNRVYSANRPIFEPSYLDDYQDHPFSQEMFFVQPKQNDLVIFPSWFTHGVPPNPNKEFRKSLGINALPKEIIGDLESIAGLEYERYA